MSFEEMHDGELVSVREWCRKQGAVSWTSPKYQSDILNFIFDNRNRGDCVVEVGCYKGGLTALLAVACKYSRLRLHSMDISEDSVESAKAILAGIGLSKYATIEQSTLPQLVSGGAFTGRPVLCILDGDHAYNAVMADIEATAKLASKPFALAFHDYSLRHPTTDERVSEAIDDYFGASKPRVLIGQVMNGTGHATKEAPQPDGHWWDVPGSEGAIVNC